MALDDKLRELRQKKELPDNVITFYFPKEEAADGAPKIGAVIDSGYAPAVRREQRVKKVLGKFKPERFSPAAKTRLARDGKKQGSS